MSQVLRRTVPRQPADWFGFYRFESDASETWRCCRVLDISPLGAGLELFASSPDHRDDGAVVVSIELRGRVRRLERADDASSRAGIEFAEPSAAATRILQTVNGNRSRW